MLDNFPSEMFAELQFYVYRLIDPRTGQTFYIGKGKKNRVFEHVAANLKFDDESESDETWEEDSVSTKITTIRDIQTAGLEVIHIIHRHGLSEAAALQVEAALIDVYPGLANQMRGHDANRGPAHTKQLITAYAAKEIQINSEHKLIFFKITQDFIDRHDSIYEATRGYWRAKLERAQKSKYILSVMGGVCKGVFVATRWYEYENPEFPNRILFDGEPAPDDIQAHYLGKKLPKKFGGGQNPVGYINCE